MSWHFLQGQEEASWGANSWAGAPSALLRLMPTAALCSLLASGTACCLASPSGTTCELSTAILGSGKSTSLREVSPVRTSATPAVVRASTASDLDSGATWSGSFTKRDRLTSTWRTPRRSSSEASIGFSGTWPTWGSMLDGVCFPLAPLVRHTHETDCSYWPTPKATDAKSGWGHGRKEQKRYRSAVVDRCARIGWCASSEMLEAVQGWPVGWTALEPLATDKFQSWLRQHGAS